ncbi:MAG: putative toxin-antitoxin system toxin component, PIN family [Candidatus Latescibacteria bacterium]|nr:putative toxin-antitoxin system toxin component, PIN family [Candidatus Latescibacterota bacterium]
MVNSLRVVLDTNILVSAFFWEGNESEIVRRCKEGLLKSITSPEILDELGRVLIRKFDVPKDNVTEYTRGILLASEVVFPVGEVKVIKEDPTDNVILETAYLGKADLIISGDKHLLKLKQFENIEIKKARAL